jgi:hypothetical protein
MGREDIWQWCRRCRREWFFRNEGDECPVCADSERGAHCCTDCERPLLTLVEVTCRPCVEERL